MREIVEKQNKLHESCFKEHDPDRYPGCTPILQNYFQMGMILLLEEIISGHFRLMTSKHPKY